MKIFLMLFLIVSQSAMAKEHLQSKGYFKLASGELVQADHFLNDIGQLCTEVRRSQDAAEFKCDPNDKRVFEAMPELKEYYSESSGEHTGPMTKHKNDSDISFGVTCHNIPECGGNMSNNYWHCHTTIGTLWRKIKYYYGMLFEE